MYFFLLNTIPVLVCPYWYKKRREIQKTEYRNTVITRTLAGLGTSFQAPKVAFFDALSNGYWCTRYFFTSFFSTSNFMIFRQFSEFSGFSLHGNPILISDLDSSSNFTSIIVVRIFLYVFFHFWIIEETQDAKIRFSLGGLPLFPQTWVFVIFASCVSLIIQKWK